ncbi:hypothetical protein [Erythrobacter aureus]|uniref:Uncharacterized protein n=1 Tax=Erythrobacter aureus TaxID=2182384 RepID=A0A345YDZ7_9SPHN|nr:hypothetical protein [Erythrobacter aureus]AXK42149.1 hypothetical protein DVR09_07180 [Erythrobacter aureus]
MSKRLTRELVARHAVAACKVERGFELPRWLYIMTVALYLAFLAMMAAGYRYQNRFFRRSSWTGVSLKGRLPR